VCMRRRGAGLERSAGLAWERAQPLKFHECAAAVLFPPWVQMRERIARMRGVMRTPGLAAFEDREAFPNAVAVFLVANLLHRRWHPSEEH
jgi:hypothetical protein